MKAGDPLSLLMSKVWVANFDDKILEGSLRIFNVVSPVLVRVAATLRFSTSTTESAPTMVVRTICDANADRKTIPESERESPGAADTATAERQREYKKERTERENMATVDDLVDR